MRLHPTETTAVVVDVQERLFPHIEGHETLANRLEVLIRGLRVLEVPITVTEQYRKGLGPTVEVVERALSDGGAEASALEKMSFSCCDDETIAERIGTANPRTVILAGIETHICLLQTSMDLLDRGTIPVIPADATGSRRAVEREIALKRIRQFGGVITTVESLLFELCRYAGTERFRAVSALVK